MYVANVDRSLGAEEWRPFVESQGFGHLVCAAASSPFPVIAPTQFVLEGSEVILHLAAPNPMLDALAEQPRAVLSVAGDWAFIPSAWKAIADEDPELGIPTTYYGAVQLRGRAAVVDSPEEVAGILRRQLRALQPGVPVADPLGAHPQKLRAIRGVVLAVEEVLAKFKYGGNVDVAHRAAVVERLRARDGPGDAAAAAHTERRMQAPMGPSQPTRAGANSRQA